MNRNEQQPDSDTSRINDLTVTGDQQSQIKGGPNPKTKRTLVLQSSATDQDSALGDLEPADDVKGGEGSVSSTCGTWRCGFNHNEAVVTDDEEDEAATAPLADLAVTEGQEEDVKGGPGSTCGTWRCGFNHNETVANDTGNEDEAKMEKLADLPMIEEEKEQVKGGAPTSGGGGSGKVSTRDISI